MDTPVKRCKCTLCDVDHIGRREVGDSMGKWFVVIDLFIKCRDCGKVHESEIARNEFTPTDWVNV